MRLSKKQKQQLLKEFKKVIDNWIGHVDFPFILLKMLEVHNNKSNDYANEESPFANIELCERGGFPAWKGVIIRLGDKYSRLLNALQGKLFKYEGVTDAFIDTAIYSIIGLIEYNRYEKEKKKEHSKKKKK